MAGFCFLIDVAAAQAGAARSIDCCQGLLWAPSSRSLPASRHFPQTFKIYPLAPRCHRVVRA